MTEENLESLLKRLAQVWQPVGLELGATKGQLIRIKALYGNDAYACARHLYSLLGTIDSRALARVPRVTLRHLNAQPVASAPPPDFLPPPYSEV
jgi:hypothetical protein